MGDADLGKVIDDKVALVTGAGQGIGRATAEAFARAGASVIVADAVGERTREVCRLLDELRDPLAAPTDPAKMAEYREAHSIGRIARPEEVAAAVLFLAGDH